MRRFFSLLIAFSMMLSFTSVAFAQEDAWAVIDEIEYSNTLGMIHIGMKGQSNLSEVLIKIDSYKDGEFYNSIRTLVGVYNGSYVFSMEHPSADLTDIFVIEVGFGDIFLEDDFTSLAIDSIKLSEESEQISISENCWGNGEITGLGMYEMGDIVTVSAVADAGYYFCGWYIDNELVSDKEAYTFCAINDIILTAEFDVKNTVVIASGTCGENLTWTLDDEGIFIISGTGEMSLDEYNYSVPWYEYNDSIKYVIIENGVTSLLDYAFNGCHNLKGVEIGAELESIGVSAFDDCGSLKKFSVSEDSLYYTSVGGVLYNKAMTKIVKYPEGKEGDSYVIPDGVTHIGSSAFFLCYDLKSVIIPNGVSVIGEYAFYCCQNLEQADLPDSVREIGSYAFYGCEKLKNLNLNEKLESIGYYTFGGCYGITGVVIPGSVADIGAHAFNGCTSLKDVVISEGATSILFMSFTACTNLESIVIPKSMTTVMNYAFASCPNIKDVYYTGNEEDWKKISFGADNEYITGANIHYNYTGRSIEYVLENNDLTITPVNIPTGSSIIFSVTSELGMNYTMKWVYEGIMPGFLLGDDIETIKIFAWESIKSIKPLCEAVTIYLK